MHGNNRISVIEGAETGEIKEDDVQQNTFEEQDVEVEEEGGAEDGQMWLNMTSCLP